MLQCIVAFYKYFQADVPVKQSIAKVQVFGFASKIKKHGIVTEDHAVSHELIMQRILVAFRFLQVAENLALKLVVV
jgi:hypothetical protein